MTEHFLPITPAFSSLLLFAFLINIPWVQRHSKTSEWIGPKPLLPMPQSTRSSEVHRRASSSTEIRYGHSKKVSIPAERSSSRSWARFCNDVLVLLVSDYSIASAIGKDVDASVSSATELASALFTPTEKDMYSSWRRGKAPPRVDWRRTGESISGMTSAQRAKLSEMTDALRVLYDDTSISRENCKAWMEKYSSLMPLLNASRKVELVRTDTKAARVTSKVRRDVHEVVACRMVMGQIGRERVQANTALKALHKEASEREIDLNKRLARLNASIPRDRDSVSGQFTAREQYHEKLLKVRTDRIVAAADVARLNAEIHFVELSLKERINQLESRFRRLLG